MTNTAAISGLVQTTGIRFPSVPRVRTEGDPAGDVEGQRRPPATDATDRALTGIRAPLVNGETGIAAQESAPSSQDPSSQSPSTQGQGDDTGPESGESKGFDPSNPENLSDEQQREVEKLKQRDKEVRAHEQAHKSAGGALTGSPSFKTVRGPDGHSYAVSGEVKIDTSPVPNNPEATIRKLEQVKRAALAPSNPSAQDRQVAAESDAKIQKARQEKREKEAEALKEANGEKGGLEASLDPSTQANTPDPVSAPDASATGRPARGATLSPGSLLNLVA